MGYSDLLKDPRWQRKRLEVMDAADFACVLCGDTTETLNVHHSYYERGRMPWDYPAASLLCLCEPCHRKEHGIEDAAEKLARESERRHSEHRDRIIAEWKLEHPVQGALMDRIDELHAEMVSTTVDAERDRLVREIVAVMSDLREKGDGPRMWTPFQ